MEKRLHQSFISFNGGAANIKIYKIWLCGITIIPGCMGVMYYLDVWEFVITGMKEYLSTWLCVFIVIPDSIGIL